MARKPKLLCRDLAKRIEERRREETLSALDKYYKQFSDVPKTDSDILYDVICKASSEGYCFTDNVFGLSWILREDIEKQDGNVYVIRFRCPPDFMYEVNFFKMAKKVCEEMKSKLHFFHATKTEYNLPYEDCVWVIQQGEIERPQEKGTH